MRSEIGIDSSQFAPPATPGRFGNIDPTSVTQFFADEVVPD